MIKIFFRNLKLKLSITYLLFGFNKFDLSNEIDVNSFYPNLTPNIFDFIEYKTSDTSDCWTSKQQNLYDEIMKD